MIVRINRKGQLELDQLFTKRDLKKIYTYSMGSESQVIRISFFDSRGKLLNLKLRQRGKAKKS